MLKSIDILIGLTVVMLALSMAVTVITQSITSIVNSRGRHLRRGLTDLLRQLDPALTPALSKVVATRVLTHPLVSGSSTPMAAELESDGWWAWLTARIRALAGGPRLGNVVLREEFTKLLMTFATDNGLVRLDQSARDALRTALANNGVADPDATLRNVRAVALQIERANPELSNSLRQNIAILQEAGTDYVAKVNSWFDQTMDRTSQRFTASTRAITFACALIVAVGLQVDTPALVNRLAADDKLREAFVTEALRLDAAQQARAGAAPQPATPGVPAPAPSEPDPMANRYRAFLASNGLLKLPSVAGWGAWKADLERANPLGLLLTALLLSLGAPWWYSALGRLLQLRSVIAAKDDAQRAARQSSQLPPAPPGGGVRPDAVPPPAPLA